ncbi:MAG: TetR/AcrR family transcriptional regulator [Solirubrobacteraceae bacterium]|nr:TetR/AcrR family transcriptional regulator [Solirubrobacteraceae bacterium]
MTTASPSVRPVRERLLRGLVQALAERRLNEVTMNDIARHARTSKRTFYEHFDDKEACFLALYRGICDGMAARFAAILDETVPVEDQIAAIAGVYVGTLGASPTLTRATLSDIIAGGDACLAARREQHERFAAGLREAFSATRARQPGAGVREIDQETAAALVGGINELLLRELDLGRADRLPELAGTVRALFRAVVVERS